MQTTTIQLTKSTSNKALLAGRILSGLSVLFLLFDAIMKIIKESHSVEGSAQLGWPVGLIPAIGIVLLACTILYIIPRTAIFGAVLLTGYLGGAVAIMVRAGQPFFFPLIFGILVWGGLFLRDEQVRKFLPMKKVED